MSNRSDVPMKANRRFKEALVRGKKTLQDERGIDLSFNDLTGLMTPMVDDLVDSLRAGPKKGKRGKDFFDLKGLGGGLDKL